MFDLSGRVAIVTGGATGLGLQIAEGLAEAGADVVVCARNEERCEQAAAELAQTGVRTLGLRCDVRDRPSTATHTCADSAALSLPCLAVRSRVYSYSLISGHNQQPRRRRSACHSSARSGR